MSLIRKAWYPWLPWLSGLGLALVFAGFMQVDLRNHEQIWQERVRLWAQQQQRQFDTHTRELAHQSMLFTQLIALDDRVLDLVRAAQQQFVIEQQVTEPGTQAARARLSLKLEDYWSGMSELGVSRLTIYVAPGATSLVRMHMPERVGDSVDALRPLVRQAFSSGLPAWGADITHTGSGQSAVLPIVAAKDKSREVIAVLEVSMAIVVPTQELESGASISNPANGLQMASFIRKSTVDAMLGESTRQAMHSANPTVMEGWRLEQSSELVLHNWWNQGLVPVGKKGQVLHDGQAVYLSSWLPVDTATQDSPDSSLAFLVWQSITPEYQHYKATMATIVATWAGAFVCSILLLVLFIFLQRRYLTLVVHEHDQKIEAEQMRANQAHERLSLALRSSGAGFWEWDIINDRASFSPEWRELCGLPPSSGTSLDLDEWMRLVHPADKRASYTDIIRHIKGETPMYENEYRIKSADGSYKWIFTRGKVVEWQPNGKAALVLGVYSDITERKQTELISIRQQAALHSLNEIASLSGVDPDAQLQRALTLGARYLGLNLGLISSVKGEAYSIRVLSPGASEESEFSSRVASTYGSLADTYCSLVIAKQDVVAEDHIPTSSYRRHKAYNLTQIESYIGAPLWVNDELVGTLAFCSRKTRHHQYDALDRDFIRLLARWVSSVVERWQQDIDKKIIIERFHKLSERLPGFLYQYQLRPDGSSFFPYASDGIKNIYNVTPDQVAESAEQVFSLIHPEDLGWVSETISYSASKLTPFVCAFRINHPGRGMIWAHFESLPEKLADGGVLWHGYASDVTSLKATESQLKETNSLRKAILDAAHIAIISTDNEGTIKTFNPGAELMLGYRADEVVDQHSPALFHLQTENIANAQLLTQELGYEVQPGFEAFIAKAREGSVDEREWHYVRKDGSRFPVLLSVSALRDGDGVINGYLGIARDISEVKRIDQMKTEFISTVSHELRTPLTAISGALGIVVNRFAEQLSEPAQQMLQIAHNNSHRLIHLVNDLLDMEKLVEGKMPFSLHSHSLRELVQKSIDENAAYATQYGVTYKLCSERLDAQVVVDQQRLLQVLANYLSNAAKFSPPNEVVEVQIQVNFGHARVVVSDKGPGVSDAFRPRLFQKFSQADASDTRQKGGTGLGLAICKEIIERMGGTLGIEDTSGPGARFYFELPCQDSTAKKPSSRTELDANKPHLLIVEDDLATAEILNALLPSEHYNIDYASTGEAALELLQLRDYDLITLDLNLPDMEGVDILRYVRDTGLLRPESEQLLPIVIISGDSAPAKQQLSDAGLLDQVYWQNKPLSYTGIDQLLGRLLAPAAKEQSQ